MGILADSSSKMKLHGQVRNISEFLQNGPILLARGAESTPRTFLQLLKCKTSLQKL